MAAQSQDSVPPAPELISRKVSLPSASPSNNASSSFWAAVNASDLRAASASETTSSSSSISPSSISSMLSDRSCLMRSWVCMASTNICRSRISFWAAAGSSHRLGSSTRALNSSSRCCAVSTSRRCASNVTDFSISATMFCTSARMRYRPLKVVGLGDRPAPRPLQEKLQRNSNQALR